VDNGDGTITDDQTGLMWEKKDDNNTGGIHDKDNEYTWAGCCDGNCASYDDYCQPDAAAAAACSAQTGGAVGCSECSVGTCDVDPYGFGAITTIWDWLVQLNAEGGSGFAGYSDWRLPSEDGCNSCWTGGPDFACPCDPAELETILLVSAWCGPSPCVDPVFNTGCTGGCTVTTCSCTASIGYWSSTPSASTPESAWLVLFFSGDVFSVGKYGNSFVRAVRGGSPSAAFLDVTSDMLD
jgi:hypothetical protein